MRWTYFKRLFFLLFVGLVLQQGYKFYEKRNDGFKVSKIASTFSYHPDWEIDSSDLNNTKKILDQPFYYLDKGGQVYVFESKDQRYVIKFLKLKNFKLRFLYQIMAYLPFFSDKSFEVHQKKIREHYNLYQGYKLAFQIDQEHSGLIFLHFNPTFNQFGSITLHDKIGLQWQIDLDQVVFILQKKGEVLSSLLKKDLDENNVEAALDKITKVLDMYIARYKKGLFDQDHGLTHNTGFKKTTTSPPSFLPIHIDLVKIMFNEQIKNKSYFKEDLRLVFFKLEKWMQQNYPQHEKFLEDFLHQKALQLNKD